MLRTIDESATSETEAMSETGEFSALLSFLANHETATPSRVDLSEGLGLADDALDDLLDRAVTTGVVEVWEEDPSGPSVILSTTSAVSLGLELIELEAPGRRGDLFPARWARRGTSDRRHAMRVQAGINSMGGGGSLADGSPDLDSLPDNRPKGDSIPGYAGEWFAAVAEKVGAKSRVKATRLGRTGLYYGVLPKPRHLIGSEHPWPIPETRRGECPACHDANLNLSDYCLLCDRSGVDFAIPPSFKAASARSAAVAVPRGSQALGGGTGRFGRLKGEAKAKRLKASSPRS